MKNLVAWPAYLSGGAMMSAGVGEIAGFGLITFSVGMLLHWRVWRPRFHGRVLARWRLAGGAHRIRDGNHFVLERRKQTSECSEPRVERP